MNRTAQVLAVVAFVALTLGWARYLAAATSAHVAARNPRTVLACAWVDSEAHCAHVALGGGR